jgi:sugar lactone lactonase YvrE
MTPEQLERYPLSGSVFAVRPGASGVPEPRFAG